MRKISSIRWTEQSVEHIKRHNVLPYEVEEVCFNDENKPFIKTGRENLHYVFGQTKAGRYLFVIVKFIKAGEVKVITARDMNNWERDYYRRKGK